MKPQGVIFSMKAIEQYFHLVLFIMLYKVVLTLSLRMKPQCVIFSMKAIEHYFYVVLFTMLTVQGGSNLSLDQILVCDHSDESY